MNPLIGIAVAVLPEIIKLIAGDTDRSARRQGRQGGFRYVAGRLTPSRRRQKIDQDPAAQAALQQKLAELALEAMKVQNVEADQQRQDALANTQGRGARLQALATTNSTIAWTAPAISYLVIFGFFIFLFVLVWLYWGAKPADPNNPEQFRYSNHQHRRRRLDSRVRDGGQFLARVIRRVAKER